MSKEATPTTGSSEGVGDHVDDQMMKNHQLPATMPTAAAAEAQPEPAGNGKKKTKQEKRKRVVRDRLPENLINMMIADPYFVHEIPDEDLSRSSEEFRASYAERKARNEKWVADDQDLIDQYLINGYAESVSEVTDDEDDSSHGVGNDGTEEEMVDIIN